MFSDKSDLMARISEHRRKAGECRRLARDTKSSDFAGRLLAHSVLHDQVARELGEEAMNSGNKSISRR